MLWFKRSDLDAKVEPGAVFRRQADEKNLVETASVFKVKADAFGIPHVHYNIMYRRPHETIADGPRVLALESFRKRYRERIAAA
ncbi:MAG: hypothetical protein ABI439_10360 [Rhodospirillales bacterium]